MSAVCGVDHIFHARSRCEVGIAEGQGQAVSLIEIIADLAFNTGTIRDRTSRRRATRFPRRLSLNINTRNDDAPLGDSVDFVVRAFERGEDQGAAFQAFCVSN